MANGNVIAPFGVKARDAEKFINETAKSGTVIFTKHALEQMADRGISDRVVQHCLERGRVHVTPTLNKDTGDYKCKVEHFEAGERVEAVAAIKHPLINDSNVIVITAYGDGEDGKF